MALIVNLNDERGKQPDALSRLGALVADDMRLVNDAIVKRMHSPVALIPQLAGHIVAAGGKRLRPMLTVATAAMCGHRGQRHIPLAACVEFIHTATLLHDDVVDESRLRRGKDTANEVWGNQASVLVGDFLFSRAFELMVEDGSLEVLRILSHASSVIAEGEVLQLSTASDMDTTEDLYLDVIKAKTAQLFAAAAEVGGVVADRSRTECKALMSYGLNLGIAFQLIDDVLDYSAKQEQLGKSIGDDFRDGKVTLPVILAFRRGSEDERAFWRRMLEDGEQTDPDLRRAIDLIRKHGSLDDTVNRARHYGDIARDALGIFPDSEIKSALTDLIDFCIHRAY